MRLNSCRRVQYEAARKGTFPATPIGGCGCATSSRRFDGVTSGLRAATITYSLYSDSGRTTVSGPTIGTNTVSATCSGVAQRFTVYGRVSAFGVGAGKRTISLLLMKIAR
ncbi:spore coat protein U domain-containing protein [Mesorhizobium sp. B3-1-7]|uniref:Csu type fimbrial protein n=1 Tax=Mesorhizobium sp. B3-1-7 TaxID=2589894 RepID=UPI00112ED8C9|nr:spore coat protein U domain-containing protein [Mesorhizobium sp. B3-1-7]TPI51931.1 spore coat protein U domain-containing protein [Mesorhizobium sp. B3-1-7]